MRAEQFAPVTRLDAEPTSPVSDQAWLEMPPAQRRAAKRLALLDALRGVDHGSHDDRIFAWVLTTLDTPTVQTLVSWLERVRQAGHDEGLAESGGNGG